MLPHPQSIVKTGTWLQIACLSERAPAEKLSLSQPNRQSKLEMVQQKVEELVHFHSDWCLHCYVMVGGDRWRACKSGEATQDERGAEANSLSISSFYPTQESFVAQADASIFSSFTPRPIRQVKLHLQRMPKNSGSCCC